jgi:endonuclease YncB( thermonuclease family)
MEPKITHTFVTLPCRRLCAILLSLLFWSTLATAEHFTGKVIGVHDVDTITVMHQGRGERIRLHGIDAPEKGQPFTNRAKQFVSDLLLSQGSSSPKQRSRQALDHAEPKVRALLL